MTFKKIQIGNATLYCGDSLNILPTLQKQSYGALLADPPYASGGLHIADRTVATQQKYCQSGQEKVYVDFTGDQKDQFSHFMWSYYWMTLCRQLLMSGALAVVFTDWRQLPLTANYLQSANYIWRGIIPWDKTEASRPVLGRYRAQAEYAVWGTVGKRETKGKVAPGAYRMPIGQKHHMTSKPVELMKQLLSIMEVPVLDPFMGAGAVGVAYTELGLPYTGIEINPHYFHIACQRIEEAQAKQ